jgi:DNA-binding MarR family transcriptional regulator
VQQPSGVALLLAQLGTHASTRFATRLAELDLTPPQVGVLRVVGQQPGLSQQAVAERLGAAPSRVVKLVDELAARGLVERRRSAVDRRIYELSIPESAGERVTAVRRAVGQHDAAMVAGLSQDEVQTLIALLRKVAESQGLDPGAGPRHGEPQPAREA